MESKTEKLLSKVLCEARNRLPIGEMRHIKKILKSAPDFNDELFDVVIDDIDDAINKLYSISGAISIIELSAISIEKLRSD